MHSPYTYTMYIWCIECVTDANICSYSQMTPMSSSWLQFVLRTGLWLQNSKFVSSPWQRTSSNTIGPLPLPKLRNPTAWEYPNCWHTTPEFCSCHRSLHTVPHSLAKNNSTLPWNVAPPFTKRTSPLLWPTWIGQGIGTRTEQRQSFIPWGPKPGPDQREMFSLDHFWTWPNLSSHTLLFLSKSHLGPLYA